MTTDKGNWVIVGFKVDQEKSVYYSKARSIEELGRKTAIAFIEKGADFVSTRYIRGGEVELQSGKNYQAD